MLSRTHGGLAYLEDRIAKMPAKAPSQLENACPAVGTTSRAGSRADNPSRNCAQSSLSCTDRATHCRFPKRFSLRVCHDLSTPEHWQQPKSQCLADGTPLPGPLLVLGWEVCSRSVSIKLPCHSPKNGAHRSLVRGVWIYPPLNNPPVHGLAEPLPHLLSGSSEAWTLIWQWCIKMICWSWPTQDLLWTARDALTRQGCSPSKQKSDMVSYGAPNREL